jgi:probable HAF family extracellular repeat protein
MIGGRYGTGTAINASGQVAGYATTPGDTVYHAFLYSGGPLTDLGTFGGTTSWATAINASGQVTGFAFTSDSASHAFLYSDGMLQDLNDLIPPGSGWVLENGAAINDAGQIAGNGMIGGQGHAFLASVCGNRTVDPGEQCDDGAANGQPGDCCLATCQFRPTGTACANAGDLCTVDVCSATGTCTHLIAPSPGCMMPAKAGRATLLLESTAPGWNRAQFRWGKGPAVPLADFGRPGGSDLTRVCVYDQSGPSSYALALRGWPSVSGGGVWTENTTGWKFKSKTGAPDGITGVTLKAGTIPLKAKVQVKAGANPAFPTGLPLQQNPSVVAQFKTSQGKWWGAVFSTPTVNTATEFKAGSD